MLTSQLLKHKMYHTKNYVPYKLNQEDLKLANMYQMLEHWKSKNELLRRLKHIRNTQRKIYKLHGYTIPQGP